MPLETRYRDLWDILSSWENNDFHDYKSISRILIKKASNERGRGDRKDGRERKKKKQAMEGLFKNKNRISGKTKILEVFTAFQIYIDSSGIFYICVTINLRAT